MAKIRVLPDIINALLLVFVLSAANSGEDPFSGLNLQSLKSDFNRHLRRITYFVRLGS